MTLDDFDYPLPPDRIAQVPAPSREDARLMVLGRTGGAPRHRHVSDLPEEARDGDLFVLNDTRVVPARLSGVKDTGGRVDALLVEPEGGDGCAWRVLLDVSRPPRPGSRIEFEGGLVATVVEREGEGWLLRFEDPGGDPRRAIAEAGRMPLPPYIRREPHDPRERLDRERYQTVFARVPGAVAAPTAGLHFTQDLLRRIREAGARTAFVTLHVGPGTFLPVRVSRLEEHRMPAEAYEIPAQTADAVARARRAGGRVVAVGTTVVRTLESAAAAHGEVRAGTGRTDLFIRPGHRFRAVDALLTNFHLPKSTLLMLVAAFAGRERILDAYAVAVREGYRFFSYGDAMLLADP